MNILKLLDMESDEWRNAKLEPGEHWRSRKIYRCKICSCITNHFWLFSPSYRAPRLYCPGRTVNLKLHDLVQEKLNNASAAKHPRSYVDELMKEIVEIKEQFGSIQPDVEMIDDSWKLDNITRGWS